MQVHPPTSVTTVPSTVGGHVSTTQPVHPVPSTVDEAQLLGLVPVRL